MKLLHGEIVRKVCECAGIAPSKDSNQLPEKVKAPWLPTVRRDPLPASDSGGWGPRRTASGAYSSSQVERHSHLSQQFKPAMSMYCKH